MPSSAWEPTAQAPTTKQQQQVNKSSHPPRPARPPALPPQSNHRSPTTVNKSSQNNIVVNNKHQVTASPQLSPTTTRNTAAPAPRPFQAYQLQQQLGSGGVSQQGGWVGQGRVHHYFPAGVGLMQGCYLFQQGQLPASPGSTVTANKQQQIGLTNSYPISPTHTGFTLRRRRVSQSSVNQSVGYHSAGHQLGSIPWWVGFAGLDNLSIAGQVHRHRHHHRPHHQLGQGSINGQHLLARFAGFNSNTIQGNQMPGLAAGVILFIFFFMPRVCRQFIIYLIGNSWVAAAGFFLFILLLLADCRQHNITAI